MPQPQVRVGWRPGGSTTTVSSLLLDTYGGASAAYSLRKLKNAYAGSAIRVRRSLDNTEQNIGFSSDGSLDSSALLAFSNAADTQSSKILDIVSGAEAAYSMRKLRNSYSGPVMRVRRSSDSAEQNIGFNSSGVFDTASLLSFVGSSDGYVSVWYDQSGNGKDATQPDSSKQPRIVIGGSLQTENGKPIIRNTQPKTLVHMVVPLSASQQRPVSIVASGKIYDLPVNEDAVYVGAIPGENLVTGRYSMGAANYPAANTTRFWIKRNNSGSIYSGTLSTDAFVQQAHYGASMMYNNHNYLDVTNSISDSGQVNNPATFSMFGGDNRAYVANVGLHECIFYFSDKSGYRNVIASNVNSYYSLYSYTINNAYVATWYDQISSNNFSQPIAANQPQIVSNGAVLSDNGKPTVSFGLYNNSWYLTSPAGFLSNTPSPISVFSIWKIADWGGSNGGVFGPSLGNLKGLEILNHSVESLRTLLRVNGNRINDNDGSSYQLWENDAQSLTNINLLSSSISAYRNGAAVSLTNASGIAQLNSTGESYSMGLYSGSFPSYMNMQEMIFFTQDKSAQKSLIEQSLNSHYSIWPSGIVSSGLALNLDAGRTASYSGSGTAWTDLSASGLNGQLVNGVGFTASSGGGLTFNGTNQYVTLGNDKLRYTDNFTAEAAFRVADLPSNAGSACGARYPIISNWYWGYNLYVASNGKAAISVYSASNQATSISTAQSVVGSTVHVAFKKSGTALSLYLNGTLVETKTMPSNNVYYFQSYPFTIGGYLGCGGDFFYSKSTIYVSRVYSRALSDAEILQNFNATKVRIGL